VFAGAEGREFQVKAIVTGDGTSSTVSAMIMRLDSAQAVLGREGQVRHIIISNNGDSVSGAKLTDAVISAGNPTISGLGLFIEPTKRDDLKEADEAGSAFTAFFDLRYVLGHRRDDDLPDLRDAGGGAKVGDG
jgi:hypothetical protein